MFTIWRSDISNDFCLQYGNHFEQGSKTSGEYTHTILFPIQYTTCYCVNGTCMGSPTSNGGLDIINIDSISNESFTCRLADAKGSIFDRFYWMSIGYITT